MGLGWAAQVDFVIVPVQFQLLVVDDDGALLWLNNYFVEKWCA